MLWSEDCSNTRSAASTRPVDSTRKIWTFRLSKLHHRRLPQRRFSKTPIQLRCPAHLSLLVTRRFPRSTRASALRVLSSQHMCSPLGFLGSAVGDGRDWLEATLRGDAIRFASALTEAASLCCKSEVSVGVTTPRPGPGPLLNHSLSKSCTSVRGGHSILYLSLPPPSDALFTS